MIDYHLSKHNRYCNFGVHDALFHIPIIMVFKKFNSHTRIEFLIHGDGYMSINRKLIRWESP